ncbi:unnamed protein product, partial [marine sediment metagenome]
MTWLNLLSTGCGRQLGTEIKLKEYIPDFPY